MPRVLKQALLRATGPLLLPDFLPPLGTTEASPRVVASLAEQDWDGFIQRRLQEGSEDLYAEMLEQMERRLLTQVLTHTEGNQVQAARILGITRGSLRNKIRSLGISIEHAINVDDNGKSELEKDATLT